MACTGQDGLDEDGMTSGFLGFGKRPLYPTNVIRLARALQVNSADGIPQIVYYQPGVGTRPLERFGGGLFGHGMSRNVREAYGFLANNYRVGDTPEESDEIFFFGFSRGSYTVRSVCGLVASLGLLTLGKDKDGNQQHGMDNFPHVYNEYYKNVKCELDPKPERDRWERVKARLQHDYVVIPPEKLNLVAIGCFDTVGFQKPMFSSDKSELPNTFLPNSIKYAFHALSIDEKRGPFKPTLFHLNGKAALGHEPVLKQVWFVGDHSDIGGSHTDHELADITLAWMLSECKKANILDFNEDYVMTACLKAAPKKSERWAEGRLHGSYRFPTPRFFISFLPKVGKYIRTPMEYYSAHAEESQEANPTREYFHQTVRIRQMAKGGYNSEAMKGWRRGGGHKVWMKTVKNPMGGKMELKMEEAKLGEFELRMRDEKGLRSMNSAGKGSSYGTMRY